MNISTNRSLLLSLILTSAMASSSVGQESVKRVTVRGTLMPMFQLVKQTGFPVAELPKSLYNFSRAELLPLPKGFAGIKNSQQMAYITYGWKKGGLVRLYETKSIPGVKGKGLLKKIIESRYFHDSYGDARFVSDSVTKNGVEIVVTSLDPVILKNAIENLKG